MLRDSAEHSPKLAWDGGALGVGRFAPPLPHDVPFATIDATAARTSPDQYFGDSMTSLDQVRIAARPGRFGIVWGSGSGPMQLHFAIACR